MSNVLATCPRCKGTGRAKLNRRLQEGFDMLKKQKYVTVARFSLLMNSELTAAHHLMRRMVLAGVATEYGDHSPARYRAKTKHECQTPPA